MADLVIILLWVIGAILGIIIQRKVHMEDFHDRVGFDLVLSVIFSIPITYMVGETAMLFISSIIYFLVFAIARIESNSNDPDGYA